MLRFETALRRVSTCEALRVRGGPTSAAGTGMGAQVWHLLFFKLAFLRPAISKRSRDERPTAVADSGLGAQVCF